MMRALLLKTVKVLKPKSTGFLQMTNLPIPTPYGNKVLIRVKGCALSRTDIDEIEGKITIQQPYPKKIILGNQVIGTVEKIGTTSTRKDLLGKQVGVGLFHSTCGVCYYCKNGQDNLCANFKATGVQSQGGLAEYILAPGNACIAVNETLEYGHAPLMSSGVLGLRALQMANILEDEHFKLGLMGFGTCGKIMLKLCELREKRPEVFVFGSNMEQRMRALDDGAAWAGGINDLPPARMDSVIDTTSWLKCFQHGLRILRPRGTMVITSASAKTEDGTDERIRGLSPASGLGQEKTIQSITNVTNENLKQLTTIMNEHLNKLRLDVDVCDAEMTEEAIIDLKYGDRLRPKVIRFD